MLKRRSARLVMPLVPVRSSDRKRLEPILEITYQDDRSASDLPRHKAPIADCRVQGRATDPGDCGGRADRVCYANVFHYRLPATDGRLRVHATDNSEGGAGQAIGVDCTAVECSGVQWSQGNA
jgi:hypothetical protein